MASIVPRYQDVVSARVRQGSSDEFSLQVGAWVQKARGRTDLAVRKVVLDLFSRVVRRSPVDTGRFRANWFSSVSAPALLSTGETDKSGGVSLSRISATAQEFVAGDVAFLSNSLPYARLLEYGWSAQAPQGMVRLTIAEFSAAVERAARAAQAEMP